MSDNSLMDCQTLYLSYSHSLEADPRFIQSELCGLRRSTYTSGTHGLPPPSIFGSLAESVFGYNPQYANVNGAGIILEESVGVGECWRICW